MANIFKLFKFIESNEPDYKIPFRVKLVYEPDSITPEDLKVAGSLWLSGTQITTLPANLKINGNLDLRNTPIKTLPADLKVTGNIWLSGSSITTLPDDLKVGGFLELRNTPLSQKYSSYEIKVMVPGVTGNIYI